ncbi:hypothetical protein B9G55_12980 [Saccharibacillus sp. O16]|nr:hypothetical protein B9G55_12980 [Saccharibacillus sp. O16]
MTLKITPPKLREEQLMPEPELYLESRIEIQNAAVGPTELLELDYDKVSFDRVWFKQVTVLDSALRGAEFTDVVFEDCDLSNMNLTDAFLNRVAFKRCKLIGTDFGSSRMQHVRMSDCIGDYANFRLGKMKSVIFEDCSLLGSDLYAAEVQQFALDRCKIDGINLSEVKLKDVDLSRCEFDSLIVNPEDLAGCRIAPHQAAVFVGLLGLIME